MISGIYTNKKDSDHLITLKGRAYWFCLDDPHELENNIYLMNKGKGWKIHRADHKSYNFKLELPWELLV